MKINIQSTKHAISWQGASYCLHDSSFFKDVCCKLRDFSGIALSTNICGTVDRVTCAQCA